MKLDFAGDLSWWQGVILAIALAWTARALYRRETAAAGKRGVRLFLPLLRAAVVFLIILCLTGPVLTRRHREGEPGKVLVFLDGSRSMSLQDDHLDDGRKILLAAARGLVKPADIDQELLGLVRSLGKARRLAGSARTAATPAARTRGIRALEEETGRIKKALAALAPGRFPRIEHPTGSIVVEYFDGAPGIRIDPRTGTDPFRGAPTTTEKATALQSRRNRGDNYGTRVRALLHPPLSGAYTFWISSDDQSVLLLGTGADPASRRVIASVPSYAPYGSWEYSASQKSKPITLSPAEEYYLEVLHQEGNGEDYVQVGWKRPDGRMERPVPATYLSPFRGGRLSPEATKLRWKKKWLVEVTQPLRNLADRKDAPRARDGVEAIAGAVARWQRAFEDAFAAHAAEVIAAGGPAVREAIRKYEALTRLERAEALLLDGENGVLPPLEGTHDIEIFELEGSEARRLWSSRQSEDLPGRLDAGARADVTNLSDGIARVTARSGARTAVVLLSDGRQNDGDPPEKLAAVLGQRGIPVFTVGLGTVREPPDLAVIEVEGPASVYAEDRLRGHVLINDRMEPGTPFTVKISHAGKEAWTKELRATGQGERRIEFDVSVKNMAREEGARIGRGVQVMSLPLGLEASIDPLAAEARRENNSASYRFRAVMHGRRILLLDGRPRWETRFIRNLFERDRQWKIDTLIAGMDAGRLSWMRGDGPGKFPRDRESLLAYELIVFGEVPRSLLKDEEIEWLRDFVEKRAGGMVFIDGRRGVFARYRGTPLAPLLPVQWTDPARGSPPVRLELTERGAACAALLMETDAAAGRKLWSAFPPPHWAAPVRALEGAETLVDAVHREGGKTPALVFRRFGAGKILYCAIDATWRWRYEVADRYHQKFWNQVATWIMESPYAVKGRFVSLDAGGPVYRAGDRAEIRVRVRGRDGKPMADAHAEAIVYRDGKRLAAVALEADPNGGGVLRGAIADLEPGEYEVGVAVDGLSDLETKARTTFTVEARRAVEFRLLSANEDLLRRMADASGGTYLREEEAGELPSLLAPLSAGRVTVRETRLAESYWWFVPILLLLTLEWILRKRGGML